MKSIFEKIKEKYRNSILFWTKYPLLGAVTIFIVVFLLYFSIYFYNPGISFIDDHLFHIKFSYLIRSEGFDVIKKFQWISIHPNGTAIFPATLYNFALIPFTFIKDMILGLKISDIFWASLSISTIYYAFRKIKLDLAEFWVFVLMSVGFFTDRMLLGRALVMVPAFLILELYFAREKKYMKFFWTSLIHVAWHTSTFFLPLIMAIIVEAGRILDKKKFFAKNILAYFISFAIGINLTFYSIKDLLTNIIGVQISTNSATNGPQVEGRELYVVDIFKMFNISQIFLIMILFSFFVVFYFYIESRKEKGKNNDLLYVAFLFSLMSFAGSMIASGRFYDFYFISTVFLFAVSMRWLFERKKINIESSLKKYIFVGISLFFAISILNSFLDKKQIIESKDYRPIGEAANWIAQKSNQDDRVFLYDWGYFPIAFFFNSKNLYTMGIEPRSALIQDSQLYWKWYNMFFYGMYCEKQADCKEEKLAYDEKFSNADKDQQQTMKKENSKKVLNSIENEFGAKFVIADETFASILKLNPDLIGDSREIKSNYGARSVVAIELK